jgi:hypothetical protein
LNKNLFKIEAQAILAEVWRSIRSIFSSIISTMAFQDPLGCLYLGCPYIGCPYLGCPYLGYPYLGYFYVFHYFSHFLEAVQTRDCYSENLPGISRRLARISSKTEGIGPSSYPAKGRRLIGALGGRCFALCFRLLRSIQLVIATARISMVFVSPISCRVKDRLGGHRLGVTPWR